MSTGEWEYQKAHDAVRELYGRAALHVCEFCGRDARDWAYNHKDPNERVARFNGCKYSTNPKCYIPLCRKCHKAFDGRRKLNFKRVPWPPSPPVRLWEFRRVRLFK